MLRAGETRSIQTRYARQILSVENLPEVKSIKALEAMSVFSQEDAFEVRPHNDDPIFIVVKCEEWEIKKVLVYQGSSADILY